MKKLSFGLKNFNKDNTPVDIAKVVNKLLIVGSAVAAIGLTIAAPPLGIAVGIQIAAYAGSSVAILKVISKMFGSETVHPIE